MRCNKCGSGNISIQLVQMGAKSSTKGKGCLFGIVRLILIFCTCGLWLLFGRKAAKTKTKFINKKIAICQNCGNQWDV
jgi:hypothetical protein